MPFDLHYVKEHPYIVGGVVLVGAVGLYVVMRGRSSGGAVSGIDPTAASLYAQEAQLQAQQTAQNNQITGQLDLAQIQANTQSETTAASKAVDLAQISSNQEVNDATIAAQLQQSNNQLTYENNVTAAQLEGIKNNNLTSENLARITAQEQTDLASTTANTQIQLGQQNTQVQLANAETNREAVAYNNQYQSAALKQNAGGGIGSIVGSVAGIVGAFL